MDPLDYFKAGVEAAKEAIKQEIAQMTEAWDQAGIDERWDYVDAVVVELPIRLSGPVRKD